MPRNLSFSILLLLMFTSVFAKQSARHRSSAAEKVDALLRHGQTLMQRMQESLKSENWMESGNEVLKALVETECELAKMDDENGVGESANRTEERSEGENFDPKRLGEYLTRIDKIIEKMRNAEQNEKVSIDGVYGTLAEILPKAKMHPRGVKLRTYVKVVNTLRLIGKRVEPGPAKDAIEKVIGKDKADESKGHSAAIMPSELIGLTKDLWTHFLQKVAETKDQGSTSQDSPKQVNPEDVLTADKQRRRRRAPSSGDWLKLLLHHLTLIVQTFAIVWIALRAIEMRSNPFAFLIVGISNYFLLQLNLHYGMMTMSSRGRGTSAIGQELDQRLQEAMAHSHINNYSQGPGMGGNHYYPFHATNDAATLHNRTAQGSYNQPQQQGFGLYGHGPTLFRPGMHVMCRNVHGTRNANFNDWRGGPMDHQYQTVPSEMSANDQQNQTAIGHNDENNATMQRGCRMQGSGCSSLSSEDPSVYIESDWDGAVGGQRSRDRTPWGDGVPSLERVPSVEEEMGGVKSALIKDGDEKLNDDANQGDENH